jgi:cytochrome c peroxidase
MNCHSQIFSNAPFLEPVRASFNSNTPLRWARVHDLPDFVYFDHSIHVNKGVGCTTCHGQVDRMPLMWQATTLQMSWCLDCHRNPERNVRPRDAVFRVDYQQPSAETPVTVGGTTFTDQVELGKALVAEYQIQKLTSCSTCHR